MLISDAVHIWREPGGEYHIEWATSQPKTRITVVPVSGGESSATHYSGTGQVAKLSGLTPDTRHSFRLSDQYGNEVVAAERRLTMEGTPNFRDFGGYRTTDGRQVKWGYLFRSGQLSSLSDDDVAILASLELDLVCDFRRIEEQESDVSRLPQSQPPRIASLPIIPGSNARFFEEAGEQMGGPQAMFDFMVEINRDFAAAQTATYARMFREILEIEDARFLVHCAAGKDRTGFAVALVLLALGVPRNTVMDDYLLTQRFFHPQREIDRLQAKYQMEHLDAESMLPMLEVHRDYLDRALDTIDQNFPSIEVYLEQELGVGAQALSRLRDRYLAPAGRQG